MGITGIFTIPLAWILDFFAGNRLQRNVFTNEELGTVIKYHQRSENHGGKLGHDATRIMLGALNLDSRRIGGELSSIPQAISTEGGKDLEKADLVVVQGMIIRWSSVNTVDINEIVDESFIRKVKRWSYSRIPVIGKPKRLENRDYDTENWEGTQIFGFLHIKVRHLLMVYRLWHSTVL